MKLYTRTGDDGTTGLHGGARVPKTDPRVEAFGQCDELNAALGVARCAADATRDALIVECLDELQHLLFEIGADLATPTQSAARRKVSPVTETDVAKLERWIDAAVERVEAQKSFILPGGTELAARLHVARTICRRAERRVIALSEAPVSDPAPEVPSPNVVYLNRAGDLLFALARLANHNAGAADVPWTPRGQAR
ncbi:MAG: cob(I)yrinic acid a,c-diamide adenosyltransferase [Phycisphaerales bacterium]|nr:cob(I)yrinic acid a,c-diamide adenosyltransferase [Phycisphaerales bacterium]